jgi:MFS family permease
MWSFASGGQFFMHDRAGFFACRFFIGLAMGGFIPDSILYLSYFYTKTEMPIRLALFWFVDSWSGVIASFIAYGVLHSKFLSHFSYTVLVYLGSICGVLGVLGVFMTSQDSKIQSRISNC